MTVEVLEAAVQANIQSHVFCFCLFSFLCSLAFLVKHHNVARETKKNFRSQNGWMDE